MGWELSLVRGVRRGRDVRQEIAYHWRPEDYMEDEDHVRQDGPYQATNAPRWFSRGQTLTETHLRIGSWDGDSYASVESLAEAETRLGRALGVAQFKLTGFDGGADLETFRAQCVLWDGTEEECEVTLEGDLESDDAIHLVQADKLWAEGKKMPYRGVGLHRDVISVSRVGEAPADPRSFDIVADVPFLHDADGIAVATAERACVALQMSAPAPEVHVFDDAVGRIFLLYDREGDVFFRRRDGLPGDWSHERQVTAHGASRCPWADKDDRGRTMLLVTRGERTTARLISADDGDLWEPR